MKRGEFLINGESSITTLGAKIQHRFNLPFPNRRFTSTTSYGQDGRTIFDEEAYDDTPLVLSIVVEPIKGLTTSEMRNKLLVAFTGNGGSVPIVPWFDDSKTYFMKLEGASEAVNKYFYEGIFTIDLKVMVEPWKLLNGYEEKLIPLGENIIKNPSPYIAFPLFRVKTKNVPASIRINGRIFELSSIRPTDVMIEPMIASTYAEVANVITENLNDKVDTRDYPYLDVGDNKVLHTGFTNLWMTPRWRVLV